MAGMKAWVVLPLLLLRPRRNMMARAARSKAKRTGTTMAAASVPDVRLFLCAWYVSGSAVVEV